MSDTTTVSAPVAAPATGKQPKAAPKVENIAIQGKSIPLVRIPNTRPKDAANKGTPAFLFIPSGEYGKAANFGQLVTLLGNLGIADGVAAHIERDIIIPLCREASEKALDTNEKGEKTTNVAAIPGALAAVLKSWNTSKSEINEALRVELAEIVKRQGALFQEATGMMAAGIPQDPAAQKTYTENFGKLTAQLSQLTLKAKEINEKLAGKK
jgi:hypothetical protein